MLHAFITGFSPCLFPLHTVQRLLPNSSLSNASNWHEKLRWDVQAVVYEMDQRETPQITTAQQTYRRQQPVRAVCTYTMLSRVSTETSSQPCTSTLTMSKGKAQADRKTDAYWTPTHAKFSVYGTGESVSSAFALSQAGSRKFRTVWTPLE